MEAPNKVKKQLRIFLSKSLFLIFILSLMCYIPYLCITHSFFNLITAGLLLSLVASFATSTLEFRINKQFTTTFLFIRLLCYASLAILLKIYLLEFNLLHPSVIPNTTNTLIGFYIWLCAAYISGEIISRYISPQRFLIAGKKTPAIIHKFTSFIFYLLAILMALHTELKFDINRILEISGLFTGVLTLASGFYFKEVIVNFLHGIIIGFNPPFEINDLVKIGEHLGFVEEHSWRTIKLRTFAKETTYIPNTKLSTEIITNLTNQRERVDASFIGKIKIRTHPDHDPGWVRSLLLDSVNRTCPVNDEKNFATTNVLLTGYSDAGAEFIVFFNTPRPALYTQINNILMNIYRVLADAGIRMTAGKMHSMLTKDDSFSFNKINQNEVKEKQNISMQKFDSVLQLSGDGMYYDKISNESIIKRSMLFNTLNDTAIESFARITIRRHFATNEQIIQPDSQSGGIHLIRSGSIAVYGKTDKEIARLSAGHVFGEMSVLHNSKSQHSVTTITHATTLFFHAMDLQSLFTEHPEIRSLLNDIITKRNLITAQLTKTSQPPSKEKSPLLQKAANFFFAI